MFLCLQALIILLHSEFKIVGSTDVCGKDKPQHEYWDSACIWSPLVNILYVWSGSIKTLTVKEVMLSLGGWASRTPPKINHL